MPDGETMPRKAKITFLTAPFDIIKSAYGSRSRINYGNLPPLGILYMIGALRREGFDAQLIDAAAKSMTMDEIIAKIRDFGSDVIGVSTMTPSAQSAYELIRNIKAKTGLPIVLGGVHANVFKDAILAEAPDVDIVSIGEGETTIVELLRMFSGEQYKIGDIKGIAYRDASGKAVLNEPRPLNMDLDTLAFPARDILDNSLYRLLPLSFKVEPVTSMISSRGCPYGKCAYCFQAGDKAFKYRRHSPEYVIKEIEQTIIPNGIREIAFWDDYFLINDRWLTRFLDLMGQFALSWSCYGHAKTVRKEWLDKAHRTGCWAVLYGFESGDQVLLDSINKGITLDDSRRAVTLTHEAGIDTRASFMLALPGETPALAKKTIDFAIDLDCTLVQFLPLHPEEGTALYELAKKDGQILPFQSRTRATYVPNGYKNAREVEATVRSAYLRYCFRWRFVIKHLRRIRSWNDLRHYVNAFLFFLGLIRK
jgi:magnesium-protoporphyrin IX monomethyl ester (oxidative) cyclase